MSVFVFRRTIANVSGLSTFSRKFSTEKAQKNNLSSMEIVAKLSERTGLYQKDVKLVLSALPKLIREELDAGHEVKLHNFVNILQVDGAARTMTHIKTKEKFLVPERKITKAKVGKFLK